MQSRITSKFLILDDCRGAFKKTHYGDSMRHESVASKQDCRKQDFIWWIYSRWRGENDNVTLTESFSVNLQRTIVWPYSRKGYGYTESFFSKAVQLLVANYLKNTLQDYLFPFSAFQQHNTELTRFRSVLR